MLLNHASRNHRKRPVIYLRRHTSPQWAQDYAFQSVLTPEVGEGYQLTVSPLR